MAIDSGASAVLLIAAILDGDILSSLILFAVRARCDVLLELHDKKDLAKAAKALEMLGKEEKEHVAFGINNRDLDSLAVDLRQTELIAPLVQEQLGNDRLIIAESGLDSPASCLRLLPLVDGFLIGTSLLRAADPEAFLSSLVQSCKRA